MYAMWDSSGPRQWILGGMVGTFDVYTQKEQRELRHFGPKQVITNEAFI
jgi:hypothetical protein